MIVSWTYAPLVKEMMPCFVSLLLKSGSRRGDIYHNIRDDVVVPLLARGVLYRNRGSSVVRLNSRLTHGADVSDFVGVYRCCLSDGCGDEKCIEITLV